MQSGRSDENSSVDQYVRDALATNPSLFAAVLGISIIDGDGGKAPRKGLTPGQRMGDSINAYYAKRTNQAALTEIDVEHIAQGHINLSGRAVGFHHEPSSGGAARVSAYTSPPDANGVYEGTVQIQNSAGQWIDKNKASTFFPQSWSEARLNYELAGAFTKRPPGTTTSFTATTPSGVTVQFVPPAGSVTQWRGWPIK
jgi:filamentous hemagglutinin